MEQERTEYLDQGLEITYQAELAKQRGDAKYLQKLVGDLAREYSNFGGYDPHRKANLLGALFLVSNGAGIGGIDSLAISFIEECERELLKPRGFR